MLRRSLLTLLVAVLSGCGDAPTEPVEGRASEVVYGDDGRREPADAAPGNAALAASVGALIEDGDLRRVAGGRWEVADTVPNLESFFGLCPDERFLEQPTAGFCSGTLIAEDLVLTAGHCLSASSCRDALFVFDYRWEGDALGVIEDDDVYRCADIVARQPPNAIGLDPEYAIFRLDRPATGRPVATATPEAVRSLAVGDPLTMLGFPNGLPLKVDAGGRVRSLGSFTFDATVDAFAGNSGSGVFRGGELVGVLLGGAPDYVSGDGGACLAVNRLSESASGETLLYVDSAFDGYCQANPSDTRLCPTPDAWIVGRLPAGAGGCAAGGPPPGPLVALALALWARRRGTTGA